MNKQIIILLILLININTSIAMEYYSEGSLTWTTSGVSESTQINYNFPNNKTLFYHCYGWDHLDAWFGGYPARTWVYHNTDVLSHIKVVIPITHEDASFSKFFTVYAKTGSFTIDHSVEHPYVDVTGYAYHILYYSNGNPYWISGNLSCIDNTKLYFKNSAGDYIMTQNESHNYSSDCYNYTVADEEEYKLVFNNDYEYFFQVDGDNIIYNYDECKYITLNFIDSCENLIPGTYGYYTIPDVCMSYLFNTSTGTYQILFEDQEYLKLYVNSFVGEMYYNITNPQDVSYNILNEEISWNNNIWVCSNNTTSYPKLSGALIEFRQNCIIKEFLNPVRNKYSDASGYAYFYQCERDNFNLKVSKTGYKTFEGDFNSNYLNASRDTQTIIVEMERDTDINGSVGNYTDYNTYINFKNDDNEYTSSIYDTDSYFDIYYFNNNSEDENMELYFQKSLDGTWININNWNINHGDSGYKRIYQVDFIDYHYSYRAILTNNEIVGWDRIKYLNVKNQTIYNETYDNLSTILWFRYKNIEDSIDYREDIKIVGYAKSDNATLLSISLELLDNNNLVEFINLTWVDFINAELKYYYEWNPTYTFIKDHNYTIKMYGYDYYLLKTDYVNAVDYRKNKLTVIVKDRSGNNLTNSYIFLEGYTSLSTGDTYYNSYDNLNNGMYRYKASKSGYTSAGWNYINITDSDNTVIYMLSYDMESGAPIQTKMSDENLQTMFMSLMVILLIFIMLGGLTHVSK